MLRTERASSFVNLFESKNNFNVTFWIRLSHGELSLSQDEKGGEQITMRTRPRVVESTHGLTFGLPTISQTVWPSNEHECARVPLWFTFTCAGSMYSAMQLQWHGVHITLGYVQTE